MVAGFGIPVDQAAILQVAGHCMHIGLQQFGHVGQVDAPPPLRGVRQRFVGLGGPDRFDDTADRAPVKDVGLGRRFLLFVVVLQR